MQSEHSGLIDNNYSWNWMLNKIISLMMTESYVSKCVVLFHISNWCRAGSIQFVGEIIASSITELKRKGCSLTTKTSLQTHSRAAASSSSSIIVYLHCGEKISIFPTFLWLIASDDDQWTLCSRTQYTNVFVLLAKLQQAIIINSLMNDFRERKQPSKGWQK